jgi:hypothetical protein
MRDLLRIVGLLSSVIFVSSVMLWLGLANSDAIPLVVSDHDKLFHFGSFFILGFLVHITARYSFYVYSKARVDGYQDIEMATVNDSNASTQAVRKDLWIRPLVGSMVVMSFMAVSSELVQHILASSRTSDPIDALMNELGGTSGVLSSFAICQFLIRQRT